MDRLTYKDSCDIEFKAQNLIENFLGKISTTVINTSISQKLQTETGDYLFKYKGKVYSMELKVEQTNKYGNFFLETWSNLDYNRANPGWMYKIKPDYLFYYFLDEDMLYVMKFEELFNWAFIDDRLKSFKLKVQKKYSQKNVTAGRVVPIGVLVKELNLKMFKIKS